MNKEMWSRIFESSLNLQALEQIADGKTKDLLDELANAQIRLESITRLAWFHLGRQAAVRLLGAPPDMHVVNDGIAEPKARLKGIVLIKRIDSRQNNVVG